MDVEQNANGSGADGLKESIFKAIRYGVKSSDLSTERLQKSCVKISQKMGSADSCLKMSLIHSDAVMKLFETCHPETDDTIKVSELHPSYVLSKVLHNTEIPKDNNSPSEGLRWLKACRKGEIEKCIEMLKENANLVHFVPPYHLNYAAVHIAVQGKHYKLMHLLRENGADFNLRTLSGYTPLHLAAHAQDRIAIDLLVKSFGVDATVCDLLGYRYDHYATCKETETYVSNFNGYECYQIRKQPVIGTNVSSAVNSRCSSRPASIASQESFTSLHNSFSRSGSFRETLRGFLRITDKIRSRSSSAESR